MEIVVTGSYNVNIAAGCCGGAYDYDPDSNCIENSD